MSPCNCYFGQHALSRKANEIKYVNIKYMPIYLPPRESGGVAEAWTDCSRSRRGICLKIVINCIWCIFSYFNIYCRNRRYCNVNFFPNIVQPVATTALICIFLSRQLSGSSEAPKSHYVINLINLQPKHWFTWLIGFTLTERREA